jgi:hypothetical protein
MATYVNNLRLKEITTGDEDGTWGTSTNTNLELVTDGFSYGTKQMAADANETFTMPDATADATRGFYLKITSAVSLTGTREVTLGPNTVSKVWLIENATTGSQIITIKQGAGATINIVKGSKVMLVTDGLGAGAAVINANPTEVGGSVTSVGVSGGTTGLTTSGGPITGSGTITFAGTLAVANGGTGVTTSTGTGAVVLGTAPTITGMTLAGAVTGADQTVSAINLKDYAEVTNAIGSTGGGTQDIDLTLGNSVTATVDTSANTFTFSNPTASDELCGFTLLLTNGGSQTVAWPASVDWPAATAPTLTAAGVDKLVFETVDGGTTWTGNLAGAAYA